MATIGVKRTAAALVLALATSAAWPCLAQDAPIATASGPGSAAPQNGGAVVQIPDGRSAYPEQHAPPEPDREPHGMVEVAVGTGGYRHAAAVVTAPIGKTGQITVAVDKTQGPAYWR